MLKHPVTLILQTAEMPDFYAKGEYDLSGFAVGIVNKDSLIDGKSIKSGDIIIGFPSSGVHSNGFSLVRRLVFNLKPSGPILIPFYQSISFFFLIKYQLINFYSFRVLSQSGLSLNDQLPGHNGGALTLGEALMAPTVIYVKQVSHWKSFLQYFALTHVFKTLRWHYAQVLDIISRGGIKGIAHITGGGFTDNIPRVFPPGLGANIFQSSWDVPVVFKWLQEV